MLTFFRRIRQSLLGSGQTRKYIPYALGEITLVVIGILIALQINNWNEWKKERAMERHLLMELAETLKRNCTNFIEGIQRRENCELSSSIVVYTLENQLSYDDSLAVHFQLARIPNTNLILSYSGYEALKNAGFEIIQSKETRSEIIDLFEVVYSSLNRRMSYFETFQPDRASYIDHLFLYDDKFDDPENANTVIPLVPMDYENLLTDQRYLALIKSTRVQRRIITSQMNASLEESQRVLRLIEKELGENIEE